MMLSFKASSREYRQLKLALCSSASSSSIFQVREEPTKEKPSTPGGRTPNQILCIKYDGIFSLLPRENAATRLGQLPFNATMIYNIP